MTSPGGISPDSDRVVQLELERVRRSAELGDFLHLQVDVAVDHVVAEDAAGFQEFTVLIERFECLVERMADGRNVLRFLGWQVVQVLVAGRTRMKATDSLEGADVIDTDMEYLYGDGEFWHFMDPTSHEQVSADASAMTEAVKWLKGNEMCMVTLWNGAPLVVTPPTYVELQIVETDPGVRGDTSGGGGKPAKLETGAVVRVPLFVQNGEVLKCDTRTGEYVSRVK